MEEETKKEQPKKGQVNVMAILSYIGVLCLIPILAKQKDEFVNFHAKQGFILFAAEVATWMVFFAFLPFLWFLGNIFGLIWLILSILGIVNVVNKEKKEIPLLGKFAGRIKF